MCFLTFAYMFSFRHLFHVFLLSHSQSNLFCKVEAIFKLFIFFKWRKQQQYTATVNKIQSMLSAIYQSHDDIDKANSQKALQVHWTLRNWFFWFIYGMLFVSVPLFLCTKTIAWHKYTCSFIHINLSQLIYRFKTISMFQIVCKGV